MHVSSADNIALIARELQDKLMGQFLQAAGEGNSAKKARVVAGYFAFSDLRCVVWLQSGGSGGGGGYPAICPQEIDFWIRVCTCARCLMSVLFVQTLPSAPVSATTVLARAKFVSTAAAQAILDGSLEVEAHVKQFIDNQPGRQRAPSRSLR